MPITTVKTIGSSGDYTTLQAWEDACPANLVTADEIWRGECQNQEFSAAGVVLTIAGQTTDATRYVQLTTASGASFADNANKLTNELKYNASNGAAVKDTAGYTDAPIVISTAYTRVSKLQLQHAGGPSRHALKITASNCFIEQIIGDSSPGNFNGVFHDTAGSNTYINCLAIDGSGATNGASFSNNSGSSNYYNCLAVKPSNVGTVGYAFQTAYASMVVKNCAGLGFATFYGSVGGGAGASGNNNASTTTISFGSSNQASLTFADQIEQPNATTGLDCRTKAGAALIANGTDLSASGVTIDIVGTSRSAPYDIGAWQYTTAAVSSWSSSSVWM